MGITEQKLEEQVGKTTDRNEESLGNIARHLPLANFAKHSNDSYNIEIDLAGVKKEDIELKVEDDYLTINALRKSRVEPSRYYLSESNFGLVSRSFVLPKDADREKISANYEDGRLYISLEKEEARKARSISIK